MKPLPLWFRMLMRVTGAVPLLGSTMGWRLFWFLGTPSAVRPTESAFHEEARVSEVNGVATYQWGDGDRVVLFAHGWRSRASRFAVLGEALVARGYTVVAFDARGHGDSGGSRTHAFEYAEAIRALADRHGPLEAVVAHSFGAIPSFMAARAGVATERIVTIAGVHDFDSVLRTFSAAVGLSGKGSRDLRRRIERWGRERDIDVLREVVAELEPADTRTALLVVHDSTDREVPLEQAMKIVEAHSGPVETHLTDGLGHNRVLSDADVVDRVVRFVETPISREQPTR